DFDRAHQPKVFVSLSDDDKRGIQNAYYTSLSYVDAQIGRVLQALDLEGLAEKTVVVYWGDNGYLLGHHGRFEKHVLYEQAVRVPLIVRWPGHIGSNQTISELVETIDVFPTLAELLEIEPPCKIQGRSLVRLMRRSSGVHGREDVFSEYLEN